MNKCQLRCVCIWRCAGAEQSEQLDVFTKSFWISPILACHHPKWVTLHYSPMFAVHLNIISWTVKGLYKARQCCQLLVYEISSSRITERHALHSKQCTETPVYWDWAEFSSSLHVHCLQEVNSATELHKLVQERLGRIYPWLTKKIYKEERGQHSGHYLKSISKKLYHWIILLRKFDMNIIWLMWYFFSFMLY